MSEDIEGLGDLLKNIDKLKGVKSNKALLAGAFTLQKYSQENAPVLTGYLRSSADSKELDNGAELEFGANYSYYQEFGTENMEGKFYVTRAIDEHKNDILENIGKQMEKELESEVK
jgi:HK97 gp10 family phage protein